MVCRHSTFARGREGRTRKLEGGGEGWREGGKENILWNGPLREEFAIVATCDY